MLCSTLEGAFVENGDSFHIFPGEKTIVRHVCNRLSVIRNRTGIDTGFVAIGWWGETILSSLYSKEKNVHNLRGDKCSYVFCLPCDHAAASKSVIDVMRQSTLLRQLVDLPIFV